MENFYIFNKTDLLKRCRIWLANACTVHSAHPSTIYVIPQDLYAIVFRRYNSMLLWPVDMPLKVFLVR